MSGANEGAGGLALGGSPLAALFAMVLALWLPSARADGPQGTSPPSTALLVSAALSPAAEGADRAGDTQASAAAQIRVLPEEIRQGDPILIEVKHPQSGWHWGGRFLGHRLRFFRSGASLWALTPVSVKTEPGRYPLELVATMKSVKTTKTTKSGSGRARQTRPLSVAVTVTATEFESSKLSVNPHFTKPPKRYRKKIRRDRVLIKRAFAHSSAHRLWRGSFQRPRDSEVTGLFGTARVYNHRLSSRHLGLDLDGSTGDPIRAPAAGRVVLAAPLYYSGGTLFIDHGLGLFTVYFHMSAFEVRVGQRVKTGDLLGKVGHSGRVTGPHLHFGVKLDGSYVSPARLLALPTDGLN